MIITRIVQDEFLLNLAKSLHMEAEELAAVLAAKIAQADIINDFTDDAEEGLIIQYLKDDAPVYKVVEMLMCDGNRTVNWNEFDNFLRLTLVPASALEWDVNLINKAKTYKAHRWPEIDNLINKAVTESAKERLLTIQKMLNHKEEALQGNI